MAANNPEGIGGKRFTVSREVHPLPGNRRDLFLMLEKLIQTGGVKKLVVEQNQPIKVQRWVEAEDGPDQPPSEDSPMLERAMSGELAALSPPDHLDCFERLYLGFSAVSRRGMNPVAVIVRSETHIRDWMDLDATADVEKVYAVPLVTDNEMPDDSILVVSANEDGDSFFSVRIPMRHL